MELRPLGGSGVRVSAVGLGTMMFGRGGNEDAAACTEIVHRCLDAGVNHIDTADGYGRGDAERIVGAALGARRDEVVLATKCYFPRGRDPNRRGGSRRWIRRAIDESLTRLRTDRIDLYYLHRLDPAVDLDESLGAMDDLVRDGKVLAVGTSGTVGSQLVECQWTAERRRLARPVADQTRYSVFARNVEHDVLPTCARYGIGSVVYGPLDGGWLAGTYRRDVPPPPGSRAARRFYDARWWDPDRPEVDRKYDLVERLAAVAAEAGLGLVELAIGFVLARPEVSSVLVGPRTLEQLPPLLEAAGARLTPDTLAAVDAVVPPGGDVDPLTMVRSPAPPAT